jgi:hypothetical protein
MITGVKRTMLTPEAILSKISEFDIFMMYMPNRTWRLNDATISPFPRAKGLEKHPSFLISSRAGTLCFVDFGDANLRGDCFTFVKLLHHMVSMDDVLKKIDFDFGLGINTNSNADYKTIVKEYKQPEELGKRYSLVQVSTRRFTHEELEYWNGYHQSLEDLRTNNVYSIKTLFFNSSRFFLKESELRFAYLYDGHWKVYRPFADKKNKWNPNNVPNTALDGQDGILCNNLLILKSKKDFMVMNKVYPYNVAVQSENIGCFSHENVDYFRSVSDRQILSFDSDPPGVKNSQEITKLFDFDYCNVPLKFLSEGIKDWADLGRVHGLKAIEEVLKQKGLL